MASPSPPAADRFGDAYEELRRLAHAQLRRHERTGMLDTTALVHESWLRVAQSKGFTPDDQRHFLCYAAKVMRSVIVDHARARATPSAAAATSSAPRSTAACWRT